MGSAIVGGGVVGGQLNSLGKVEGRHVIYILQQMNHCGLATGFDGIVAKVWTKSKLAEVRGRVRGWRR